MHLPFTPNHVQLISACYPPSAALLTSGPEYRPNAQELSKLTYYAVNRPGKITKLASELEKRIKAECKKAHAGYSRSRASLLISLSILKALATECRRDISLLTPSLLASVDVVLENLSSDLEVSAKVASAFRAWTTYTDGRLVGADQRVTKDYLSILEKFSRMSTVRSNSTDHEFRNRTRLVGLAALSGAVTSEALYTSSTFRQQSSAIVSALLMNIQEADLSLLETECNNLKEKASSPYLEEFRTRPSIERRAASIHVHIDGERGPSMVDIMNACLRALSVLFDHANGGHIPHIIQAALSSIDQYKGWEKIDHCRWFASKASEWTQYQYRYAVPTKLVERLLEDQDMPVTTPLHIALVTMVTTIFTSSTPIVNLSTSDVISNLITLLLRRASINPDDALIPSLTECISSLGTHVYYSDQIQDLSSELISRLISADSTGVLGRDREASDRGRVQALRSLLAALVGLINAQQRHDAAKQQDLLPNESTPRVGLQTPRPASIQRLSASPSSPTMERTPRIPSEIQEGIPRPPKRTKISPEVWKDTLYLLCDGSYAVRADYARSLIFYMGSEVSKRGDYTDADGVRRLPPLAEGPMRQASNMFTTLYGDEATRFLHAVHVYLYVLATATSFGLTSTSSSPARSTHDDERPMTTEEPGNINVIQATPDGSTVGVDHPGDRGSPTRSQPTRHSLSINARSRRQSTAQQLLVNIPTHLSSSSLPLATASDYRNITSVLVSMHEHLPLRALLTGVPFLLALDSFAELGDDSADPECHRRARAIKEVLARVWLILGRVWACQDLVQMVEHSLSSLPESSRLPPNECTSSGVLIDPEEAVSLPPLADNDVWPGVDVQAALRLLSSSKNALDTTGMDSGTLQNRLSAHWNAESALKDSMEPQSSYDALRGDGISPRLKLAPALMHIENMSLASLTRSTRGVGVTDLREALEGRASMSNPALVKPPSVSTLDHTSTHGDTSLHHHHKLVQTRSRPEKPKLTGNPSEVRDMLNKLRIGKPNGGTNLLKASFPSLQKQEAQSTSLLPPYKS